MAHQVDDQKVQGQAADIDDTTNENKQQQDNENIQHTSCTTASTTSPENADSVKTEETFSTLTLSQQDLDLDADDVKQANKPSQSHPQPQPQPQVLSPVIEHDEEGSNEYQIHISNADDVNGDLNGLYKIELNEDKIPQILHKQTSLFTPNFMYYFRSYSSQHEYAIFIIPSLESMQLYKPTWVVAQLNQQSPIYYYAQRVDFSQENAMQVPQNRGWLIVGADDVDPLQQQSMCTMQLRVVRLKPVAQRQADFAHMFEPRNKDWMRRQMQSSSEGEKQTENKGDTKGDTKGETKGQPQPQKRVFDAEDVKVQCVEMVGHENILKVTGDLHELKKEWNASELGNHDELEMFLGAIGKIIDIEEDDDTVKLEWSNNDCHWLPARACWITWSTSQVTAPNFYPDQDEENDDTKVLAAAFSGQQ